MKIWLDADLVACHRSPDPSQKKSKSGGARRAVFNGRSIQMPHTARATVHGHAAAVVDEAEVDEAEVNVRDSLLKLGQAALPFFCSAPKLAQFIKGRTAAGHKMPAATKDSICRKAGLVVLLLCIGEVGYTLAGGATPNTCQCVCCLNCCCLASPLRLAL